MGRALSLEDAVHFALDAARARATIDSSDPSTNTQEFEIARLAPSVPALRVSALGALDVQVSGVPIAQRTWGYAKSRELLMFLLMHREGRTREQVGAALWPDASPTQVRNNFHVALHHLRKALGGSEWVQFDRERYRVVGSAIEVDASRFEEDVTRALRRAKRGEVPVDELTCVVGLYRGDFMEGEQAGDWHLEFRDRLSRLHAEALEVLGGALLDAGRFDVATGLFERLIRQEPLHEDAYTALMLCRARAGDRTAAMREYRRLEAVLRRELDSSPGANASDLFRRLQRGESV
jgi:DNA-binding SARP family transcriptional activator